MNRKTHKTNQNHLRLHWIHSPAAVTRIFQPAHYFFPENWRWQRRLGFPHLSPRSNNKHGFPEYLGIILRSYVMITWGGVLNLQERGIIGCVNHWAYFMGIIWVIYWYVMIICFSFALEKVIYNSILPWICFRSVKFAWQFWQHTGAGAAYWWCNAKKV